MSRQQIVIAIVVLALGGSAALALIRSHKDAPTADAPSDVTVDTHAQVVRYPANAPQLDYLKSAPVVMVPAPLVEPMTARVAMDEDHTARVFSPVTGRVLHIFVEPGAVVKKGQPLVEIDSPDYASTLSDLRKANADFELKKGAWKRQQDLVAAGVAARKDMDAAEADYYAAKAEQERATQNFRNLNADGSTSPNGSESKTLTLRAPLDGVLASREVNPGTQVRPDATDPLFVITDMGRLWVMLDAPESALGHLAAGQKVTVLSDTDSSLNKTATIASLPANVDPTTRRLIVRCIVDNSDSRLRPEMFVRAIPYADNASLVARVPDTALVTSGLYTYVFVETAPGTLERRRVHVAMQGHGESFIDQGLKTGEKVVVTGALLLDSELHGSDS